MIKLADFDHRCTAGDCPHVGQRTSAGSCLCHVTREDMLLLRVAELDKDNARLKAALEGAVEIGARFADANARLIAALTPSGETKMAYIGEVKMPGPRDGDRPITVTWTATKEIMKMIRAYAAEPKESTDAV